MLSLQGSHHYETVSGFVCEAFGYIPRTGESTKVVLRKADFEEGERRDGDGEHQQEDRRDKFQKYRLDVSGITNSRQNLVLCLPLSVWPNKNLGNY